ncbi:MAG TPA: DUF2569 family protein [Spirochaetia bacterium]|nr:DUF2569 family protein [Spirochaetia bacterium]
MKLFHQQYVPAGELAGVRGWLLFVCVYLTIILPLLLVLGLPVEIPSGENGGPDTVTRVYFTANIVVTVGIVLFSVIAGLSLWLKKRFGVALARVFLLLYAALCVIDTVVLVFFNLVEVTGTGRAFTETVSRKILYGLLVPVALVIYLQRSKRVRNTFFSTDA